MAVAAPALETPRLLLRGHVREDLDDCAAMWGDALVTRHLGGRPFTREEVWSRLLRYVGHWQLLGYGFWTLRDKETGRFAGEVGFANLKREVDAPFSDPEIGWVLAPASHGRGLATEAVNAVLAWGDAHLSGRRMVCMIDPANAPSLRVAEKCGFREYARTPYKGVPVVLLERARIR